MKRGRRRREDPTIPAHIKQVDIPSGAYWNRRDLYWYTLLPTGTGQKRVKLADKTATLADIHAKLDTVRGIDRTSLDWLMQKFEESPVFLALEYSTQKQYQKCRLIASQQKTKIGPLGKLAAARLTTPVFQGIVDRLALEGTPTKANHFLRYVRRVYSWGVQRGHVPANPCKGCAQADERKRRRLPDDQPFEALIAFAKERAEYPPHTEGSIAPYMWMTLDLMYLCRLRGIEAITLPESHGLDEGVLTNRRKGSRDNIVAWTPRLRAVWHAAAERRRQLMERHSVPTPIDPKDRALIVGQEGRPISKNTFNARWQAMMKLAIEAGVITAAQRFGAHDVKRKGISDSPGNRHDKQQASGHRSERMMDVYDLSVPVVPTSEKAKKPV